MGQFDMFEEPSCLHIIRMGQDKLCVLRGRAHIILTQFLPSQGAIHEGHGNRFAFGLPKDQTITAGELRRLGLAACELVHGFTFADRDLAQINGKAQFGNIHRHSQAPDPQFAHERVVARIAPLRGISHGENKPLIATRQGLKFQRTIRREIQGLARQITRGRVILRLGLQ